MKRVVGILVLVALVAGGVSVVGSDSRNELANVAPPLPMGIIGNPDA